MPRKHYTPPLSRFIVCALFHQAKLRSIPMTQLANEIMQAGLKETPGWQQAIGVGQGTTEDITK